MIIELNTNIEVNINLYIKRFIVDKHKNYIYIYLNPLKPGIYKYNGINYIFNFEPFYIGKGSEKRIYDHLSINNLNNNKNKHKINTIKKILKVCSKNEYKKHYIIKIEENLSEILVNEREKYYISKIGRKNLKIGPLVNLTDGGEGTSGYITKKETKEKLSKIFKGRFAGKNHPMYGKIGSLNPKFGKRLSEELKQKISKNHADVSGKNNPMYGVPSPMTGKQHSQETRAKLSKLKSKVWFLINPDKEIIGPIFDFQTFCKIYKLDPSSMTKVYKKKIDNHKQWKVLKRYSNKEYIKNNTTRVNYVK